MLCYEDILLASPFKIYIFGKWDYFPTMYLTLEYLGSDFL
jgi:hypothetical protein